MIAAKHCKRGAKITHEWYCQGWDLTPIGPKVAATLGSYSCTTHLLMPSKAASDGAGSLRHWSFYYRESMRGRKTTNERHGLSRQILRV